VMVNPGVAAMEVFDAWYDEVMVCVSVNCTTGMRVYGGPKIPTGQLLGRPSSDRNGSAWSGCKRSSTNIPRLSQ
jgi:hypothetical protein